MRKNVAGQHITFALVVASTGAALVGASPAGFISKDGAAQAALTGTFTGLGNGQYDYAPVQAETNANEMGLLFTAATAVPVGITIYTTAADPSNAASLGLTDLDATISSRSTLTQAQILSDATPFAGAAVGGIKTQTDKLAFTVANQVDANVIDWKGAAAPAMTGDAYARLGAPAGVSVSADVAAVKGDTAAIKLKTDNLPASPAAVGSNMGTVSNVTGDVQGKVLGGGASAMTAAGVRALDASGNALAVDSTVAKDATVMKAASYTAPDNADIVLIKAKTDNLPSDPASESLVVAAVATRSAPGDAMALTTAAMDAIMDRAAEGSLTFRQLLRIVLAFVAGKANGAPGGPINFRDQADTKNRIAQTVDANGDRTSVSVDGT